MIGEVLRDAPKKVYQISKMPYDYLMLRSHIDLSIPNGPHKLMQVAFS